MALLELPRFAALFRRALAAWYERSRRDLPWRRTGDPFRILVSEVMLQQTRVTAVIPYYERFLARFPDATSLASAPEADVLAAWSGLGYYSRARNLQKAAIEIVRAEGFPREYGALRALAGVGDYTAAAVASIAFGLPHAVLDGNVARVLARLSAEPGEIGAASTRKRLQETADELLDRASPGEFNQALMELGAVVCLPRDPQCARCPVARLCAAHARHAENELPVKARRVDTVRVLKSVLVIRSRGRVLLGLKRGGFWELPEESEIPGARPGEALGAFRHSITNRRYEITVRSAVIRRAPDGFEWITPGDLARIPLSTIARKALRL
jgi:A/G-specific adenine glycosylase